MSTEDTWAHFPAAPAALAQAFCAAGGIQALARYLRVPKKQLTSWMEGDVETPSGVLVRAIAFVRGGR